MCRETGYFSPLSDDDDDDDEDDVDVDRSRLAPAAALGPADLRGDVAFGRGETCA